MNPATYFPEEYMDNSKTLPILQKIVEKFGLQDMTEDEQNIFFLEFARVAQLRYENRLSEENSNTDSSEVYIEEFEKFCNELLSK